MESLRANFVYFPSAFGADLICWCSIFRFFYCFFSFPTILSQRSKIKNTKFCKKNKHQCKISVNTTFTSLCGIVFSSLLAKLIKFSSILVEKRNKFYQIQLWVEWPSVLRPWNQNLKVPGSNPTRCLARLRDPSLL